MTARRFVIDFVAAGEANSHLVVDAGFQIAIITAGAAVVGTLSGAVASFLGSKRLNRDQWRLSQIDKEITSREKLYGEFLGEASLLGIRAIDKKVTNMAEFATLYKLLSEIKLVGTAAVIDAANRTARRALESHSQNPPQEDRAAFGETFSEACRAELDALRVKALRKVD